jgi:hypothetical protein
MTQGDSSMLTKWMSAAFIVAAMILMSPALRAAAAAPDEAKGKDKADKTPATSPSADQPGPNKFYGTVTAIDANAKTFTVDNQTYAIVPESQITKAADDKPATIADAVVGEPARGSYTKSSDGKLNVTKVRFGKKTNGGGKSGGKKNKEGATKPAAPAAPKE